jgi:hypothetical protein
MTAQCVLVALALAWPMSGIDPMLPADMSGVWVLNVERSTWDGVRKPLRSTIAVVHRDPRFTYSGSILYASEETRDFSFEGSIDRKPYAMTRSFGPGKITMWRADPNTVDSLFRSDDGRYEESARTRLSADGRTLTRAIRFRGPVESHRWLEVYEKQ